MSGKYIENFVVQDHEDMAKKDISISTQLAIENRLLSVDIAFTAMLAEQA